MRAVLVAACLCLFGVPSVSAQSFAGTYVLKDQAGAVALTLTLRQEAGGAFSGTFTGKGVTLQLQARVDDGALVGTMRSDAGSAIFEAEVMGTQLALALIETDAAGTPNPATARQLVLTRHDGPAPAAAPAPAGAQPQTTSPPPTQVAPAAQASAQDAQLIQLLTSSSWCTFTYNKLTGTSTSTKSTFFPDGRAVEASNRETYTSGDFGSVAGQYGGGQQGRWRVQQGMLQLSADGLQWSSLPLQVYPNSNGYPIIKAQGKEYSRCQ